MKISHSVIISLILLLSATTAHSATYYFHNDHLGTPQVLTDENQAVVWKGTYDPFGKVTETVATVEQNLRFPGQYLDRESGLHYNYFRTYDPEVGRYTQSDPIGLGGGINTYGYVLGNPLRYFDRFGLKTCVMITRNSYGIGNHAALFVERGGLGGGPLLYDPAGNYSATSGLEGFGDGVVVGDDANIDKFTEFHKENFGDTTEVECKATTAEEEELFGDKASNQGSFPFMCSLDASAVIAGSSSFPGVTGSIWFPGNFIGAAKK